MSKLMERALEELAKLPEAEQEAIWARILEEIEDERRWDEQFAKSQDVLEKMAKQALEEHRAGKTKPLEPDEL